MRNSVLVSGLAMLALHASGASAAKPGSTATPPALINQLLACRSIGVAAARLACFDQKAAQTGDALDKKSLVVIDREAVHSTRRSLFGLALPDLDLFSDSSDDAIKQIEGIIATVSNNRDGGYVFTLAEGSRWTQVDDRPIALEPRGGEQVIIKKAAMGSYMLSVNRQPGVRVRRIN